MGNVVTHLIDHSEWNDIHRTQGITPGTTLCRARYCFIYAAGATRRAAEVTRERDDDGASEYAENAESHLWTKPMEWTGSIQQLPSG